MYRLQVGIPVFGNHSIFARAFTSDSKGTLTSSDLGVQETTSKDFLSEIAWHYDTTDDPILPAAGTIWRTGVAFNDFKTTFTPRDVQPTDPVVSEANRNIYFTSASHYSPVTDSVSLTYGGEISVETFDVGHSYTGNYERSEIAPHAGITASLWSDRLTRRLGDLRFESNVSLHFNGETASFDALDYRYLRLESAIVQRNVWGSLRFSFRYDDSETF